jgi:hypothetical protein
MIGREDTGTFLTNHMRAFKPSFAKAETGFKIKRHPMGHGGLANIASHIIDTHYDPSFLALNGIR